MKHKLTIAIFLASLSSLAAQAPSSISSKLAGIQRFTVPANSSRPIGVNFVRPPLAAGRMDSCTATTFTDNQVNFGSLLAGKNNLWLELTNGNYPGMATLVTVASGYTLNTEDSLVPYAPGAAIFAVREAHTVASLFGAANSAGLQPSSTLNLSGNPDEIHIPDGAGGYHRVFYSTPAGGWREDGDETSDASGIPIYHVDAVIVHRKQPSALTLSFVGFVRSTPTYFPAITSTTTIFNAAYPTGTTLTSSGLATQVKQGTELTADIISIPTSSGGWDAYYYATASPPSITAGWKQVGQGNTDKGSVPWGSTFRIERRGVTANVKLLPGPSYSGL